MINFAPHPPRGAAGQVTLPGDQGQHRINNTTTPSSQRGRKKMKNQAVLAANSMLFHSFPDRARNFLAQASLPASSHADLTKNCTQSLSDQRTFPWG